jgi:hypothetical protein
VLGRTVMASMTAADVERTEAVVNDLLDAWVLVAL